MGHMGNKEGMLEKNKKGDDGEIKKVVNQQLDRSVTKDHWQGSGKETGMEEGKIRLSG